MSTHARTAPPVEDPWALDRYAPAVSRQPTRPAGVILVEPLHTGRRTAIAVLAVLVVLAVAGFLLAQPVLREYPATLTRPDTVAGMNRLTDADHWQRAEHVRTALSAAVPLDDVTVGFYAADTDPSGTVLVAAGTHLMLTTGGPLDAALGSLAGDGLRVGGTVRVNPGFLGGTTECGQARDGAIVCAWADHGSLGIVAAYDRDLDATAALMREVRAEILHRY